MAMFQAILSRDAEEVKRLLKTDPTLLETVHRDWPWSTPLVHAAIGGHMDMVRLVVEEGADLHATSDIGRTAIHYAARQGHEGITAYLLDNGASPIHQDQSGYTPLMCTVKSGHARVARLLLEHMGGQGLEASSHYGGHTALHLAVNNRRTEFVTMLLNHGARADTTDSGGRSALQTAVARGPLEVVKLLLDHLGPEALQERDRTGRNLLHFAAGSACHKVVAYLLSKGLRPYMQDNRGETALMCGARMGSMTVMQMLLKHMGGHRLDQTNDGGWTALHRAVDRGSSDIVKALLLAGADPYVMDKAGRTPRVLAHQKGKRRSIAIFQWWDGGVECAPLLYRARALHDAYTTYQEAPTRPVPGYLKARVEAGLELPQVEVLVGQQSEAGLDGYRKRTRAATRTNTARIHQDLPSMVGLVVEGLSEELFTELMQGFCEWRSEG